MVKREELQFLRATVTTSATCFGTSVASDMRRYYYWIKVINAGKTIPNLLVIGYRKGGTVAQLDATMFTSAALVQEWPSGGPREDSLPIYVLPPGSRIRLSSSAGTALFYGAYADGT